MIGRLPVLAPLRQLNESELFQILTEPKNAITKQYQKLMKMDKVNLKFDKDALEFVSKIAYLRDVGARALRGIIEDIMLDHMFDAPTGKVKSIAINVADVNTFIKLKLSKQTQEQLEKKVKKTAKPALKKAA